MSSACHPQQDFSPTNLSIYRAYLYNSCAKNLETWSAFQPSSLQISYTSDSESPEDERLVLRNQAHSQTIDNNNSCQNF